MNCLGGRRWCQDGVDICSSGATRRELTLPQEEPELHEFPSPG